LESLAVVIGARLVGSLTASTAATARSIQVNLAHGAAIKQNAAIDLQAAQVKARQSALEVQLANNRLAHARIIQQQTGNVTLLNGAFTALARTTQANVGGGASRARSGTPGRRRPGSCVSSRARAYRIARLQLPCRRFTTAAHAGMVRPP
jgi:hypothetical protein